MNLLSIDEGRLSLKKFGCVAHLSESHRTRVTWRVIVTQIRPTSTKVAQSQLGEVLTLPCNKIRQQDKLTNRIGNRAAECRQCVKKAIHVYRYFVCFFHKFQVFFLSRFCLLPNTHAHTHTHRHHIRTHASKRPIILSLCVLIHTHHFFTYTNLYVYHHTHTHTHTHVHVHTVLCTHTHTHTHGGTCA